MPTLEWIGKDKVMNHHLEVPYRILDEVYTYGAESSENKIIRGDNLEALKALLPQYEGHIKCIYIDPPYNTGNEKWVYNDNVNDPKIKKWLGEVVGKEGDDLSRHDKWLCMMYPRLKLLQRLLSDDGVIFISIDDNEQANLKLICDEIFGIANCIGPFIQNKMNAKNDTINIQKNHEFILAYRKCTKYISDTKIQPTILNTITNEKRVYEENNEFYYLNDAITTRGEGGILNARCNLGYTVYYNPTTQDKIAVCDYDVELAKISNDIDLIYSTDNELIENGYIAIRAPKVRGKLGCWTWSLEKFNDEKVNITITGKHPNYSVKKRTFIDKKDVIFSNGTMKYVSSVQGNSRSILDFSTNEGTIKLNSIMDKPNVFENSKSPELLEYLISLINDKNAIILDSFAGSGTTAHAVLNINKADGGNRKFILVEMENYAEDITAERVKRVIDGYKFIGKKESELYAKKLTINNLEHCSEFLNQATEIIIEKNGIFDKISKPKITDNCIKVIGTKNYKDKIDGLGGDFTFYDLGVPLLVDNQYLNVSVPVQKLREYIFFMETTQPMAQLEYDEKYFLGTHQNGAYYFIYEKDGVTTLDYEFLGTIKTASEEYIIYADINSLSREELKKYHIVFKKIPRDITKL